MVESVDKQIDGQRPEPRRSRSPQTPPQASPARREAGQSRTRRSHVPAYLHIANNLSDQIAAGVYRSGDQLPTEPQLRAQYGVSPMTVRRAIMILLDRGLVTTTQGKGTFVRSLGLGEAVFHLQEITDLWTDDATVDVLLLEARIVSAQDHVASALRLSPGDPVVLLRRLIHRLGEPLIYQLEHVVYDERRPLVEAELQVTSLEGLLRSPQVQGLPGGRLSIRAVSLDAEAARLLKVAEGSPAFCLESLFQDFDSQPLSWGQFLCRADQFRLTTTFGAALKQTAGAST